MKKDTIDQSDTSLYKFLCDLRQEKLFIKSEKLDIQKLNEVIRNKAQTVIKASWLTNKQRLLLLDWFITTKKCQNFDFIHITEFVEAKNLLGFQSAVKISNLLHILRSQPKQLANWLITSESNQLTSDHVWYPLFLQSILNGLYGGCVFGEDTKLVLTLLLELAKKQLLKSEDPRKIFQQRTCSFKQLYYLFHEIYQPAKIFLTAALELPILEVLAFTEFHLDIDHEKSIMRFRQDSCLKCYKDAVEYRNDVASKLAQFANTFVQSLMENLYGFPKALAWIVCHIYKMVEKSFDSKEANAVITELLFSLFICPVILEPEKYGINIGSTSDLARHNLIQVGRILQILALYNYEGIDTKYSDIFEDIDKNCIGTFVELLFFGMDCPEPPVDTSPEVRRDVMLFTEEELNNLIDYLQKIQIIRMEMEDEDFEKNASLNVSIEEHLSSLTVPSRDNSPKNSRPPTDEGNSIKKPPFFSLGTRHRRSNDRNPKPKHTVIIFPIDGVICEPIGLLPEEKVIDLSVPIKNDSGVFEAPSEVIKDSILEGSSEGGAGSDLKWPDEGSLGNTSDNLEAISEAASNHSVASSLELENEDQNDNLSDMVSANVSGRGTPNISGRDTPSSQVNENEDRPQRAEDQPVQPTVPSNNISRQRRSEIDDKFCKFEIKRLLEGDETVSIISETWSTDVLASDTETVGDVERPLIEQQDVLSETQSEGAWSTDVAASDTDRMTEVENDQSDDTRSEIDEAANARRLSTCSSSYGGVPTERARPINGKITGECVDVSTSNGFKPIGFVGENSATTRTSIIKKNPERPTEILLSNCSLNSSSSGSSSNSFENKAPAEQWEPKPWLNSSGSSLNVTLTPSESTSELSILSNSHQTSNLVKKTTVLSVGVAKTAATTSASTGAIPKSISFDMTVVEKTLDEDGSRSKRGGFFGRLRKGFKKRPFRNNEELPLNGDSTDYLSRRNCGGDGIAGLEVTEDILAKYRKNHAPPNAEAGKDSLDKKAATKVARGDDDGLVNAEINSISDVKKKLRLVLGNISEVPHSIKNNNWSVKIKLETILRFELGKARKLREWSSASRASEALRCVQLMDECGCAKLIDSLEGDLRLRATYLHYLRASKQELLFTEAYLNTLHEQIKHDQKQGEMYFVSECVKEFLHKQEDIVAGFIEEFKLLSLADEKCDALQHFYNKLYELMHENENWHDVFRKRDLLIKVTLERYIISRVYYNALYPNGDGDRDRDRVLHEHIATLSKTLRPEHKDLLIPVAFLRECPWLPAQEALRAVDAARAPGDKIRCVSRCAKCLVDLLGLSGSSGAADDFTPVLVYVIINEKMNIGGPNSVRP
ncbi:hypothetical protein ABEB36_006736 [Hypothenemus hampei]|uniref:Ras-GAP domain-containing protein n=1 Tax=Hypothenemus hampei TaxID=57062 RepID=A0ABD1ES24_HYPHA